MWGLCEKLPSTHQISNPNFLFWVHGKLGPIAGLVASLVTGCNYTHPVTVISTRNI